MTRGEIGQGPLGTEIPVALLLLLPLLTTGGFAQAQNPGVPEPCPSSPASAFLDTLSRPSDQLRFLWWEGQVLGQSQPGSACWVRGDDGSVRLEVLPDGRAETGPGPLLRQEGQGYTLVLGPEDGGTFNPWGREWRTVAEATASWVRFLTGWLDGGDPAALAEKGRIRLLPDSAATVAPRPRCLPLAAAAVRVQLPMLEDPATGRGSAGTDPGGQPGGSFRRAMTGRAAGRGGNQEVLTLRPEPGPCPAVWTLTSSRKPGRLRLGPVAVWSTGPLVPEVFLPLWPLGQLLDLGTKNVGTPRPGAG